MSMSPQAQQLWEKFYEIQMTVPSPEPKLKVRAKTTIVCQGAVRYMGEIWELPERFALGLVGLGEVEQVIEEQRPMTWSQNAPGPMEGEIGSRESKQFGEQQKRQTKGTLATTAGQPQQDQTRSKGEPGGSGPGPQR